MNFLVLKFYSHLRILEPCWIDTLNSPVYNYVSVIVFHQKEANRFYASTCIEVAPDADDLLIMLDLVRALPLA